jgi:hypothetical protein
MLKDYLLDRLPKVRVLDVHDDPMHERLRVRLVPGGRQPIDHAYSFRRCLDEGPKTHTEKGDTSQLLGGNYPHTSINWYGQDSALITRTGLASWPSSATVPRRAPR